MKQGLDAYQRWVNQGYRDLIFYVIQNNPGFNVSQITERVFETRDEWLGLPGHHAETASRTFPKGKPTRKTIRKHLQEMLELGKIVQVSDGYVSASMYIPEASAELNERVRKLLSSQDPEKWNFTHAGDVAACYISSDPALSHQRFQDLFTLQPARFRNSSFWLDDILREAIIDKHLSNRAYSKEANLIDTKMVRKGWSKYFGDCELFVFSIAISPPKFLKFLTTHPSRALVANHLQNRWDSIVKEAELEREKLESIKKKQEK